VLRKKSKRRCTASCSIILVSPRRMRQNSEFARRSRGGHPSLPNKAHDDRGSCRRSSDWEGYKTTIEGYRSGVLPFEGSAYGIVGHLTLISNPPGAGFRSFESMFGRLTLAKAQIIFRDFGRFTFEEVHDWRFELVEPDRFANVAAAAASKGSATHASPAFESMIRTPKTSARFVASFEIIFTQFCRQKRCADVRRIATIGALTGAQTRQGDCDAKRFEELERRLRPQTERDRASGTVAV
jgi:hypothetical protein